MGGKVCQNCGSFIDSHTVKVMYPEGVDIPACPHCPDIGRSEMYDLISGAE